MGGLFSGGSGSASTPVAETGLSVSTSVYGLTLPVIYGATRVPGNMIWYGDFKSVAQTQNTGKGGGNTVITGYTYYASFAIGICEGEIAGINSMWKNGVSAPLTGTASILSAFGKGNVDGFTVFTGAPSQSKWGYLTTFDSLKSLNYNNLSYICTSNYNLGSSATLPEFTFEVFGHGYGSSVTGVPDVDPGFIITDLLTNARYGAGFPAANIGTWTSYKAYCIANGLLFSPSYDTSATAAKAITELLALTNSEAYFSEGLLKITPYGDTAITANGYTYTPNVTPIYELGDDAFLASASDPVLIERGSQADAYNQIDIECLDRSNSYNKSSIRATDQVNVDVYGLRAMSGVTAHQICNTSIAQSSAQLILQRNLYIRNKYTFTLPINYILLEPTDYVTLDDAALGLVSTPVRILTIDESGDELLITAEDAPPGVGSHAIYGTQSGGGGGVNNLVQPGNTGTPNIFVPPSVLTATGLEVWMGAYGVTPSTWGGCEVWVSYDNVSYGYVGSIDSPARMGTLTATLATGTDPDTTNTLSVNVLSGQPMGSATVAEWNNYASLTLVDGEYIAYQTATLTSANQYNLTNLHRGLYGSTIATHASSAPFVRVDSAMFKMPITPDKIGQTIYVKLPAYNQFGSQLQQLSVCTPTTFTIGISQVPTLTGIVLTPVYGGFTIKYTAPTQADFGGVNVYMSTTSGFTPGSGNLVYSGPDSLITITTDAADSALVAGTTYYVRVAGYTKTSKANMSYSAEYSVVPIMASKTAVASLYQWSTATPPNPSGTSTFTWSTYASSAYTGAGGWSVTAPVNPGTPGIQLWIASKVVSDNASATTTTVSWASGFSLLVAGANGANGASGTSGYQSASPTVYQWAATIPATPAGSATYTWSTGLFGAAPSGWSLTAGTSPYAGYTLWAAKVSITETATATATTTSFNWTSSSITSVGYAGTNGASGLSYYTADVFKQAASAPSAPNGGVFDFTSNILTPPSGWSVSAPSVTTTPTWYCQYTFNGTGVVTATTWSTPVEDAVAGANGSQMYTVWLYQQATTSPVVPSGTITCTFATGALSGGTMGSWSTSHPASSTTPVYMTMATFTGTAPATTSSNGIWSSPVIVAQNGTSNGNLCYNSNFDNGLEGWGYASSSPVCTIGTDFGGWFPTEGHAAYIAQDNATSSGYAELSSKKVPIIVGQNYEYQVKFGAHRCKLDCFVYWHDSAGYYVGNSALVSNNQEAVGGTSLSGYKITGGFGVAPTGAATGQLILRKEATASGASTSFLFATQAFFAQAPAGQTVLSNWSPTASQGVSGASGQQGASSLVAYMASATTAPGSSPNPEIDTGSTTVPSSYWGLSGTWGTTVPTLTAGQFLYSSDGIYNPATNQTTWSIPYWTSLKVGSLSAITINTGNLTVTGTIQGNTAAISASGTTMTGAGYVWYASGQYALGNSATNITFNGTTGTLNGTWVATGNLFNNAATAMLSASATAWGVVTLAITISTNDLPLGSSTVPIVITAAQDVGSQAYFDIGVNTSDFRAAGNLFNSFPPYGGTYSMTIIYNATPGTYYFSCFNHGTGNNYDSITRVRTITAIIGKR